MKDRRRQNDLLSYRISILQSTYQQPNPMVVQGFIVDRRKESSEAAPSAMVLRSRGRIDPRTVNTAIYLTRTEILER